MTFYCPTISPEPICDRGVVDSLFGLINNVANGVSCNTSTKSSNVSHMASDRLDVKNEESSQVLWLSFVDGVEQENFESTLHGSRRPLLLLLGTKRGVLIWSVEMGGDARLLLVHKRHGALNSAVLLCTPQSSSSDNFASRRPLLALCPVRDCRVHFLSLRTNEEVGLYPTEDADPVFQVRANSRYILALHHNSVSVLGSTDLKLRACIQNMYPASDEIGVIGSFQLAAPVCSLGSRWLAIADSRLVALHQSQGGNIVEPAHSMTATVISTARSVMTPVVSLFSAVTSSTPTPSLGTVHSQNPPLVAGVVSVVDLAALNNSNGDLHQETDMLAALVAHFPAHGGRSPLGALCWDSSGVLLASVCRRGHSLHLFRIHAHPLRSCNASAHHLYVLRRGDTPATILDIALARDSRWLAASSSHGTTHLFPVTPYGGAVTARTHLGPRIVNRASRFQRSAGLEDLFYSSGKGGWDSPPGHANLDCASTDKTLISKGCGCPPLHQQTHSMAQIRQPLSAASLQSWAASAAEVGAAEDSAAGSCAARPSYKRAARVDSAAAPQLAAAWAKARAWFPSTLRKATSVDLAPVSSIMPLESNASAVLTEALFVANSTGELREYRAEVRATVQLQDKVPNDSPVDLQIFPRAQWCLLPAPETPQCTAPLPSGHPLLECGSSALLASQKSPLTAEEVNGDNWLAQVEMVTYAGPARRLWMGPQFSFRTYQCSAAPASLTCASAALLPENVTGGGLTPEVTHLLGAELDSMSAVSFALPIESSKRMSGGPVIEAGSFSDTSFTQLGTYSSSESLDTALLLGDAMQDLNLKEEDFQDHLCSDWSAGEDFSASSFEETSSSPCGMIIASGRCNGTRGGSGRQRPVMDMGGGGFVDHQLQFPNSSSP